MAPAPRISHRLQVCVINEPNFQLRAKRPALRNSSVLKTTKSDDWELDDLIVHMDGLATKQNLPSDVEYSLGPSYSVTLS